MFPLYGAGLRVVHSGFGSRTPCVRPEDPPFVAGIDAWDYQKVMGTPMAMPYLEETLACATDKRQENMTACAWLSCRNYGNR